MFISVLLSLSLYLYSRTYVSCHFEDKTKDHANRFSVGQVALTNIVVFMIVSISDIKYLLLYPYLHIILSMFIFIFIGFIQALFTSGRALVGLYAHSVHPLEVKNGPIWQDHLIRSLTPPHVHLAGLRGKLEFHISHVIEHTTVSNLRQ